MLCNVGAYRLSTGAGALCWNCDLANLDLHGGFAASSRLVSGIRVEWRSMSGPEVRRPGSATTETSVPPVAPATPSVLQSNILPLGAFAALLLAAATLILLVPSGAGSSTLKCYDSAGNYEPCGTRASASAARADSRTAAVHRPPGWIVSALYRPSSEQPGWETADQPVNPITNAPVNSATNLPAARRSGRKHLASACGRRLMPCFFSAVRRGITHLASAAGAMGPARAAAREHL